MSLALALMIHNKKKFQFVFSRIKKDEDQGKEKCHAKSMMSKETNIVYYESLKRELKTKNYTWISV